MSCERRVDRLERGEQVVDAVVGLLAPGDAVADRPRVRARVDDRVGARHGGEGGVEALADGDDVAPAAGLVASLEVRRCRPAVDDVRQRRGDAEAVLLDRREELRLPGESRARRNRAASARAIRPARSFRLPPASGAGSPTAPKARAREPAVASTLSRQREARRDTAGARHRDESRTTSSRARTDDPALARREN